MWELIVIGIFLIAIGMLIVMVIWCAYMITVEILAFVMDKLGDLLEWRDKEYGRIAREWFEMGNHILKKKKWFFIPTWYGGSGGMLGVYCKGEKCYEFNLNWSEMGRVISKKGFLFLFLLPLKVFGDKIIWDMIAFKRISKESFIETLITSDSSHHVFSFDTVDLDLLPDWVTAELVAKKLEES